MIISAGMRRFNVNNVGISTPPEFIGVSARGTATAVTMPTHQAGDLLIIQYMTDANGEFSSAPSGWTLLPTSKVYGGRFISLAYKIATSSSEPTLNISSNVNTTIDSATWVFNIRGANPSSPINAQQNSSRTSQANPQIISGLTTTSDNCLILSMITSVVRGASGDVYSSWNNPNIEVFDVGFTDDNGGTFGMAVGVKEIAGLVADTTVTGNTGRTGYGTGNCLMLAISPK